MKGKANKRQQNEAECTICMQRNSNTQLNGCLHQFCIRCIKKWSKNKNTCPLCRERFHTLRYRNKEIEVAQPIQNTRPQLQIQAQQPQRRIIYLPVLVYSPANCFIYPGSTGYMFGQSMDGTSGARYPMNTPFFMPTF